MQVCPTLMTTKIQDFIASYFDELNIFEVVELHWMRRDSIGGAMSYYLY